MKKTIFLALLSALFPCVLKSQPSDTSFYKAELQVSSQQNLVITLSKIRMSDTVLYFVGSPMQTKEMFSPSKVKLLGDTLSLGFKKLNAVIRIDTLSLQGTFKQGLLKKDILFEKTSALFSFSRPQTPLPPFTYESRELSFTNPDSRYVFHGTLTYPKGKKSYPLVILVSGSGCQNRDEEIFQHKPFMVIADYLSKNGVAVFRYDDRGFGEQDVQMYKGTTMDFAQDTRCAIEMLRKENIITADKIGIIGHSEGGMIAQILANEVDFVIMMAAPAINGKEILALQGADLSNYSFDTTKINDYWLKYFYDFEPKDYLQRILTPVLVLQGEKDCQVFAKENIPAMKACLPKAEIKVYPNLNHLFQPCNTGEVSEYANIEQTISEDVLKDILQFIKKL